MCCNTGIILIVTRPATIIRSLCRGLKRIASAPNRARSKREEAVAINSIPQQAVAKGIGQSELRRAQFTTFLSWVVNTLSGRVWGSNICWDYREGATRKPEATVGKARRHGNGHEGT